MAQAIFEPNPFPYTPQHLSHLVHSTHTYLPMKMEQTECSETSAFKIQTPGNYPKEIIQHSEHGKNLKSRPQRLSPTGEWNGQSTHLPDVKVQEWLAYSQAYCKSDRGLLSLTWSGFSMPAWPLAMFQPYGIRLR